MAKTILELRNLTTCFPVFTGGIFHRIKGYIRAVDNVSLDIREGEVLGLVGESGCGKSTLGRSIMQLEKISSGSVHYNGHELNRMSAAKLNSLRTAFQMVFQDPYSSLNPRMTVFETLREPLIYHSRTDKTAVSGVVSSLVEDVGLPSGVISKYPHELSGGQRQRVAIARALSLKPGLIIADEPVSALDVSVQAQILNLLQELITKYTLTMLFISHDLSVIRHMADRTAVMYLGRIVEIGGSGEVFKRPAHPYTRALVSAIPVPDPDMEKQRSKLLLSGDPPSLLSPPAGCRFHTRCPRRIEKCMRDEPEIKPLKDSDKSEHLVACHLF